MWRDLKQMVAGRADNVHRSYLLRITIHNPLKRVRKIIKLDLVQKFSMF